MSLKALESFCNGYCDHVYHPINLSVIPRINKAVHTLTLSHLQKGMTLCNIGEGEYCLILGLQRRDETRIGVFTIFSRSNGNLYSALATGEKTHAYVTAKLFAWSDEDGEALGNLSIGSRLDKEVLELLLNDEHPDFTLANPREIVAATPHQSI